MLSIAPKYVVTPGTKDLYIVCTVSGVVVKVLCTQAFGSFGLSNLKS